MADLDDLIAISQYAGSRYDLIQAGGGNTSVKTEQGLFVKASGLALSDVSLESGYCCVDWKSLAEFIRQCDVKKDLLSLEQEGNAKVREATLTTSGKPSIETLMHCLINRLTLHTHPIAVAAVACRPDYTSVFESMFDNAVCVGYNTPGAALAVAIEEKLREKQWQVGTPAIVFLQNHGLIVSAQTVEEIIAITENVTDKVAEFTGQDFSKYKLASDIANFINQHAKTSMTGYLSEDIVLSEVASKHHDILVSPPATPDQLVYCGASGFVYDLQNEDANLANLKQFLQKNGQPPKVFSVAHKNKQYVVILAPNLNKARAAEDVLKAHCLTLLGRKEKAQLLPESEIAFLSNWDAEKYRQKI